MRTEEQLRAELAQLRKVSERVKPTNQSFVEGAEQALEWALGIGDHGDEQGQTSGAPPADMAMAVNSWPLEEERALDVFYGVMRRRSFWEMVERSELPELVRRLKGLGLVA